MNHLLPLLLLNLPLITPQSGPCQSFTPDIGTQLNKVMSQENVKTISLICLNGVWVIETNLEDEEIVAYGVKEHTIVSDTRTQEFENGDPMARYSRRSSSRRYRNKRSLPLLTGVGYHHGFVNDVLICKINLPIEKYPIHPFPILQDTEENTLQQLYEKRKRAYLNSKRLKEQRRKNHPRYVIRQRSRNNGDCQNYCERQTHSVRQQLDRVAAARQSCLVESEQFEDMYWASQEKIAILAIFQKKEDFWASGTNFLYDDPLSPIATPKDPTWKNSNPIAA